MKLRRYQARAVERVLAAINERPICCMPTGSGKTVLAAHIIQQHPGPVVFLVHRRELVHQAVDRLAAFGVDAGIVMATTRRTAARVQVCSIQTLARRTELPPATLVIVDECHHAVSPTWASVIEAFDTDTIGLTATPYRLDGRGLGAIFGCIVTGVTPRELCESGDLVEPTIYSHPVDFGRVKVRAGDYAVDALGLAMSAKTILGNTVEHWMKLAGGTPQGEEAFARPCPTVAFAVNIAHSRALVSRFREAGVEAEHVDGTMPVAERDAILARLACGTTKLVSNCMVLGEGWDLPMLECAILARPTKSRGLYLQQVGRIMRACPGKEGALILDHAGNYKEHGDPLQDLEFSLDDDVREAGERCPTKLCPECFRQVPIAVMECPGCGYSFAVDEHVPTEDSEITELDGKLERVTPHELLRSEYTAMVRRASAFRWKLGAARHSFKQRFGKWPRHTDIEREHYECSGFEPRDRSYGREETCGRCYQTEADHQPIVEQDIFAPPRKARSESDSGMVRITR